jgi:hypothetical protein
MATKPDIRRRALSDDAQANTFGAWPRHQHAGRLLGPWVIDQVHVQGGRLTGTAPPGTARACRGYGMVDDNRTALSSTGSPANHAHSQTMTSTMISTRTPTMTLTMTRVRDLRPTRRARRP